MISSLTVAVKWQLVRHMLHRCSDATVTSLTSLKSFECSCTSHIIYIACTTLLTHKGHGHGSSLHCVTPVVMTPKRCEFLVTVRCM